MKRAGTLAVALAVAGSLIAAGGAVGALTYEGCISGEEDTLFVHCPLISTSAAGGAGSGLDAVESVTVAPDSRWVYGVARADDSIARFKRGADGALTYKGCITGDTDVACEAILGAVSGGAAAGLDDVRALVISDDGRWAYAAIANDDAVTRFRRDTQNGMLKFKDCITGIGEIMRTAVRGTVPPNCEPTPSGTLDGDDSGLDHPKSLVLSGDGTSLYVAATNDAAVTRFKRDTQNGKLTYKGCITGETESGPTGSGACDEIDAAGSGGDESGLDDARGLALARNDRALFGVSSDDDAIFSFRRNRDNGRLEYGGCLSGETETTEAGACDAQNATAGGVDSGLDDLRSLAVSRDGSSLYVVSRFDAAIHTLPLAGTGSFTCLSAETESAGNSPCASLPTINTPLAQGTGFASPESVVVSGDGRSVYVSSADDDAVTRFRRDRATGALTHKGCITGEEETGPAGSGACAEIPTNSGSGIDSGLDFLQFMALSPDDESLYVAAAQDDAVATFAREP